MTSVLQISLSLPSSLSAPGFTAEELLACDLASLPPTSFTQLGCKQTFKNVTKALGAGAVLNRDNLTQLGDKCVTYMDRVLQVESAVDTETEGFAVR